jgi:hypothetical protein
MGRKLVNRLLTTEREQTEPEKRRGGEAETYVFLPYAPILRFPVSHPLS